MEVVHSRWLGLCIHLSQAACSNQLRGVKSSWFNMCPPYYFGTRTSIQYIYILQQLEFVQPW